MHVFLIELTIEHLQISAATINVLLMLDRELNYERLIFVGEGSELVGKSIEAGVLRCLET